MTTAAAVHESLYAIHGVELRYQTSSAALIAPILAFLRHFHTECPTGAWPSRFALTRSPVVARFR